LRAVARALFGRPVRNERAYTLIEMTITVWILGAIMVTLVGSLLVMVKSSDQTNRKAMVDQELRRFADAIRALPYEPCAGSSAYTGLSNPYYPAFKDTSGNALAIAGTVDAGPSVKYYVPNAANPTQPSWTAEPANGTWPYNPSTGTCNDSVNVSAGIPSGAQQLTIVVLMTSAPYNIEILTFTKRADGTVSDDS
jgi:type II secretory pathway pseudopilin PulG